ncbi:hypothetical protein LMIY3S_01089 [Labrys miyagiensis]
MVEMSNEPKDPFSEGEDARLDGYSEDANPYDPETEEAAHRHWRDGWVRMDRELGDSGDDA